MRNALILNIYEKTIVVQLINIEEHYLITNPKKRRSQASPFKGMKKNKL